MQSHQFDKLKEKKYLLTASQYQSLLPRLREYIAVDKHGLHTICNLYFDTDRYDLIRHSVEPNWLT